MCPELTAPPAPRRASPATPLSPGVSVLLDLTRIALSLIVAVAHWTQKYFQNSWPDLSPYAIASVGGFFVLSGFTIRMIYPASEDFSLGRYVAERWSRILSVTVPALVLTTALDAVSAQVNPAFYLANWGMYIDHPLQRLLINLLGVSQVWGHDVSPLSNSPFWSIGYELGFYLVYGLWLSGRKTLAIVSLIALGPQIALLLPLWLLGAVVYEAYRLPRNSRRRAVLARALVLVGVLVAGSAAVLGARVKALLLDWLNLDLQRASVTLVVSGAVFLVIFLIAIQVLERLAPRPSRRWQTTARWLGNMTFPLYLFHFPLFVLLAALNAYQRDSTAERIVVFCCVLACVAIATPWTNRLKLLLRGAMTRLIRPQAIISQT